MAVNSGSARLVFHCANGEMPRVRYARGDLKLKVGGVKRFFGRMLGKGTSEDYSSQAYSAAVAVKRLMRGAAERNHAKYFDMIEKACCLDDNVAITILLRGEGMLAEQTAGAFWGQISTPAVKIEVLKKTNFLIPAEAMNKYIKTGPNPPLHYFSMEDNLADMKNGPGIADALVAYVKDKGDDEIAIPNLVMLVKIVCAFNKAGQIEPKIFEGMMRKIKRHVHMEDEQRDAFLLGMIKNGGAWKHAIGILYEKERLWDAHALLGLLVQNPDKMSAEMQVAVAKMVNEGLLYAKDDGCGLNLEFIGRLEKTFKGDAIHSPSICLDAKKLMIEAYGHLRFKEGAGQLKH